MGGKKEVWFFFFKIYFYQFFSTVLAGKAIGIFAISTFDTDYILVKQDDFEKAIDALDHAGYTVERNLVNRISPEQIGAAKELDSSMKG